MDHKTIQYCLISPIDSVEEFLKTQFHSSSSKLKKYFKRDFLNRSMKAKSILSLPVNFVNEGMISANYQGAPLEIIYEDELFLVFIKNPNQHIHPLTYDEGDNCLSYLRQTRPELLRINPLHYDRGLLYRLDYETSGVVVFVKNDLAYQDLRAHFNQYVHLKKYWCWVSGELKHEGSFTHYFSSRDEKGKRVVVSDHAGEKGELALTSIHYNQELDRTLVEVSLKTGLRHQIRAQLAYLGHPLVGDTFYQGPKANRLYLHACAYQLKFQNKDYFFEKKPLDFNGL